MKTVIITGANGDIGAEIALSFATLGYNLALIYNKNQNNVKSLIKHFNKINIKAYKCDLTDDKQIKSTVEQIIDEFKVVDVLVNCAGVSYFSQIQDITIKDYKKVMDSNLLSTAFMTKYVSKNMISNQNGKIINISSMWGKVGASMESIYSASKGAINALTLSLAKELGPSNITVNAVLPGVIEGKMNSHLSPDDLSELKNSTPIERLGTTKDVANLVEFLASDKASFITGQLICVDGGFCL